MNATPAPLDPVPYWRFRHAVKRTGATRVALYGAGQHTRRLLDGLRSDPAPTVAVICILDDTPRSASLDGIPVLRPAQLSAGSVDSIVISSDSVEMQLSAKAGEWNTGLPVICLYDEANRLVSERLAPILCGIQALPGDWHGAGSMRAPVFEAMCIYGESLDLQNTAETGAGKTTLLFSQLSRCHTVFALDGGGSISMARQSPFFRASSTRFVEGPTQLTLPVHRFEAPLDMALIDGPHGYPFPELEYYYLYPRLRTGAILMVDDIHIPTVRHLFDVLCEDEMFKLEEVVLTTAFFRRTDAPVFAPTGDGWFLQGYNRNHFPVDQYPEMRTILGQ